jgi:transposase
MPKERLVMRKVKEILRAVHELGQGYREVSEGLGVSLGVVSKIVNRAKVAGLMWAEVAKMEEAALEERLYGRGKPTEGTRPKADPVWIHTELKKAGVTLELLHLEYLSEQPHGYKYTQFCEHYRQWLAGQRVTMRQRHRAGERAYVDYSGKKPSIVDQVSGEAKEVELFVGVLGASNYTFAEATRSQKSGDFIESHVRMLEFFGGVPSLITPDQLKSGVSTSCLYDPEIQRTYEEMALHYGCAVVAARPRRPRDKAKVEVGVQVVQRWILSRLRQERFFSLGELSRRIRELAGELNERPMRDYEGKSRRELFELVDKPALLPLPTERFVLCEWKTARVNVDYHVVVDGSYYSVPHALVREQVDVRATARIVEVFHRGQRMASHERCLRPGSYATEASHMPRAHQEALAWPPSRLMSWADSIGQNTGILVRSILEARPHPEQGYRPCLGILRLTRVYGRDRLERACQRAHRAGARSYRHVAAILKNGLDQAPLLDDADRQSRVTVEHDNVRGPEYFN